MKMGKLLASTAVAAVLAMGVGATVSIPALADVEATTMIGKPEELIGKNIVDEQGKTVGEIDSVLIDKDGKVKYVIVGVGGFLGIGEQNAALRWDSMKMSADGKDIVAPVTKESLASLPPHRYPDDARSGKVYNLDEDLALNPYLSDETNATTTAAAAGAVDSQTLIGKDIVNPNGDTVGKVESVIIDQKGNVKYVIAGVGGFLGLGKKDVALKWDDLSIAGQGERVSASVTKEQLEALPEYKQPDNTQAGTVYSYDEAVRQNQYMAEGGQADATVANEANTTDIDNETTVTANGLRASQVVGAKVENPAGDNIGEISEVILQSDGKVNGVVVDVGGFLGVGERPVLLNWKDLKFTGIEGDMAVTTGLSKDQLTTFPEYKASK
jgi:sporulation protein YlmC with PRC-barrel domain